MIDGLHSFIYRLDLQGIIRQLKENPSAYLLHGNQIKEFKP